MKNKLYLIMLLIPIVLISGCNGKFTPSVSFEINKNTIEVKESSISDEFITAKIIRMDSKDVDTVFVLKFPQNLQNMYPTDANGNRVSELTTRVLRGSGATDTLQFKVFGIKGEAAKTEYELKVQLFWNNTEMDSLGKTIRVIVK